MLDDASPRRDLPTGTVTFLRTDVEGSMGLARRLGGAWDEVNADHLGIIRGAVQVHGGVTVRTEGDALFAAFPEAAAGARAAIDAQLALDRHAWPDGVDVRVRMGLHSGEAHLAGDDYGGFDVNRAARIAAIGHGGQIVLSGATQALVESSLPDGVRPRSLGRVALKDVPIPEHLYQLDVTGLPTTFPPLRVADASSTNLPVRLTSFVGRDQDLVELGALLDTARLVTLTGPGGIGKTSLAIELARSREGVPDGVWFVALDAIDDASQVGAVIARTLGLFDGTGGPAVEALPRFLADRSMVLVLDNFEHVLEAAGDVAMLLRASPGTRIVVASRSPLHLVGEQEYPVRPLPIRAQDTSSEVDGTPASMQLFVDRARAVRPGWDSGPDTPIVAEICALLDGLPLGIELAAARTSLLPPAAIRDRLAAQLPLPGTGPRDAPARQRTLAATIEWSHDLLSPGERHVLHDLSVFQEGFDLEQAEHVVCHDPSGPTTDDGDVLGRIISLADHSLISRGVALHDAGALPLSSGVRFAMLRTVEGFAAAKLAEDRSHDTSVHRRHAETFLALAQAAAARLQGSAQPLWLDRLGLEQANLRVALEWSISAGDTEIALGMVGALWRYWLLDGLLHEGAAWVERAFAMPGAERPTPGRLQAVAAAGSIAYWRGQPLESLRLYEEEAELAARLDDPRMAADASFNLSAAYGVNGDLERSRAASVDARRRFEALGDDRGVARVDWGFANLKQWEEGPAAAFPDLPPLLERTIELDDAQYVALVQGSLAWVTFSVGDMPQATAWAMKAMAGNYAIRDLAGTTISLPVGAVIALIAGRPGDAVALMGAFESLCERYGVRPPVPLRDLIGVADPLGQASALLTPDVVAEQLRIGRRMTIAEAVALTLEIGNGVAPGQ